MAITYVHVIDTQLVGQEFKQDTKKYNIINENEDKSKSVKNDSFYQSNQYVGKDNLGIDGKAKVEGIEDTAVKKKVENILNGFSEELIDAYILINAGMQGLNKQEQHILKTAMEIEKFLQNATGGKVTLSDITVENGRIKGLDAPLDKLLNNSGLTWTYYDDYRADILAVKNYERLHGNGLVGGFSARYTITGRMIQC